MDTLQLMDEWGPEKVVCVSDRKTGMRGVLVIDNSSRGMGKGGTRMGPTVSVQEIARLARTMTWKWASVDLYHGGAKAGIVADPRSPDKEAILRAFARALSNEVPAEYVFGLDMGLTERDAAIMADELGDRGAAVGLPRELGGLPYDDLGVTGFGVAEATEAAAEELGFSVAGSTVAIQGFGAVGQAAAQRLVAMGATVIGVSTADGAVISVDGLDIERLMRLRHDFGDACVQEYGGAVAPDRALLTGARILIPAAKEDTIDVAMAREITAELIVEGANLPATPEALGVLDARGIAVVPDFIANAGGIVAAAYSMDVRRSPFTVDPEDVFRMISRKLRDNTSTVISASRSQGVTPHAAARAIAEQRVRAAMELRGQITGEGRP